MKQVICYSGPILAKFGQVVLDDARMRLESLVDNLKKI